MKTTSEREFERFLTENGLPFERVEETTTRRPDYLVQIGDAKLFFEVKEISEDEDFAAPSYHRTLGDHIRAKIGEALGQVQYGASQGVPSVLVIYNNLDSFHLFGTEDKDFISAMYGLTQLCSTPRARRSSIISKGETSLWVNARTLHSVQWATSLRCAANSK